MSQLLPPGTYAGCRIISAVLTTNEFGEQVVVDCEIEQGVKRRVYLSLSEEKVGENVPFKDWTVPVLEYLGFNGDFTAITFEKMEGIELYCKHKVKDGVTKEQWFINTDRFAPEPAARDVASRASARYKAYSGGARPGGAPKAPPGRTASSPAPSRAPAAPAAPAFDKDKAWEAWDASPIKENKGSVTRFYQTIEGMGKPEESFTADDWKKVAAAADTPF